MGFLEKKNINIVLIVMKLKKYIEESSYLIYKILYKNISGDASCKQLQYTLKENALM